ncbi:MAG: PTS sugar transporter subunit IIB [Gemmatimonadetes bacterium]|uniref:PTS sugar transporter subunit IIB n=1 Tax=Candidatus Kutchimonas denitrificans TaxID=3056748 RepID=A0AAE4Z8N5_9BACT|nr:PTS sugar transporter subunit IIB [Gemmatimonadota bacterium]NIR75698.1 PTS sugar transporter subunit IIB [Candidatus Kutchimonas denitrificans]NIS00311.1 PTS sugar transporter subunit IIB [Gemmatimonadota bacterium]NIT65970.1 PTS sugar transporter subunit IIB [Gemmatimonadota bacterium]NIU53674.1 PTS transporter subunit IIB [Gemmatimonadota bacterium]
MPILLCRVDDRLIHGQVVVGWGAKLGIDYIAVVDDDLAASEWEQELYRAGLPDEVEARFATVDEAADSISAWKADDSRGFILTRDIGTMRRLAERGALAGIAVNLGGLHDAPGRDRVFPYLYLSDADREELERLRRLEVEVSARDVPSARKVGIDELLDPGADRS